MNFRNTSSRSMFRNAVVTILATAGQAFGVTPCLAADLGPAYAPKSQVVAYDDLNLANPKGAQWLYERIASAAKAVCDSGNSRSLVLLSYHRACVADSIEHAVNAVGSPQLTAVYHGRTGRTGTVTLARH
jgi:UrcA family protein